ncbi:MAG: hypothetical protein RIF34_11710 [Candidatus Kapaibacterium sp.]
MMLPTIVAAQKTQQPRAKIDRGTELDSPCTHDSETARFFATLFLEGTSSGEEREIAGATGIPVSQLSVVDDTAECQRLSNLIENNVSYQNEWEGIDRTRYHYKTDDFYFVFWVKKELKTSPVGDMFLVISKDLQEVSIFYF